MSFREYFFEPDWYNRDEHKWCIIYDYDRKQWKTFVYTYHQLPGAVYFRTEKDALDAISSLTEEELDSLLEE